MDSEIKRQWVEALRSGKYKQGKNYLHQDDKFCCLGVLCELVKDKLNLQVYRNSSGIVIYEEDKHYLPKRVIEAVKLETEQLLTIPKYPDLKLTPAQLNDRGFTFNEIADMIEEQL